MAEERRVFPRHDVNEEAEILISDLDMRLPCMVANMSAGGAKVICDAAPPPGAPVVLFLKGGLAIKGVSTQYSKSVLGVRFVEPLPQS